MASWPIFDVMLLSGRPSTATLGLQEADVLYQGNLYASGDQPGTTAPLYSLAESMVAATTGIVLLDIESHITQADYINFVQHLKSVFPTKQFGGYGVGPSLSGNVGVSFGIGSGSYTSWQAANDAQKPLFDEMHFGSPTFYFRHGRIQQSVAAYSAHIAEGRRVADGKPIYPWIWPWYDSSLTIPKADETVGSQEWARWIDFIRTGRVEGYDLGSLWDASWLTTGCDGCLLWTAITPWNANFPWWIATQERMAAIAAEPAPSYTNLRLTA